MILMFFLKVGDYIPTGPSAPLPTKVKVPCIRLPRVAVILQVRSIAVPVIHDG
jgi:hypothetical protein